MQARPLLALLFASSLAACSSADGELGSAGDEDSGTADDGGDGATTSDAAGDGSTDPDVGGGSDATPGDTGSATDGSTADTKPPPDPPPVPGAVYGAKCAGADANDLKAWEDIAIVRGKAKMGALDCIGTIQTATRNHANYMQLNGGLTHTETAGKPGFTGVQFWDRMKAAGFSGPGSAMFEVIHSLGDGHGSILGEGGWINTLYHRIPFVTFKAKGYGFGTNSGKWATIDFASGGSAPSATAVSTWPVDGDTGVWTTFRCASEIPNPLPGQTYAGYPVSVSGASALTITEHVITGPSGAVEHVYLAKGSDSSGLIPAEQVYMIPKNPLAKSTRYDVHVVGKVGSTPIDLAWSFTTGAK